MQNLWEHNAGGGPHHHILGRNKALACQGWAVVDKPPADLVHAHGVYEHATDVLSIHAVWPVTQIPQHPAWWDEQNSAMAAGAAQARVVLTFSQYTASMIREVLGVHPKRLEVLPEAIDPQEWYDITAPWARGARPVVVWGKNTVDMLRDPRPALELARLRSDCLIAMTCGHTDLNGYVIPENVLLLGRLPFDEMQALLFSCDVYLATTLEASAAQVIEALHLGKPILGYNWGGTSEMVPQTGLDRAGVLVPPGDITGLVAGLGIILGNYPRISAAARVAAQQHYWPDVALAITRIYESLL